MKVRSGARSYQYTSQSPTGCIVFVPALSGLACPYWDGSAVGLWLGMDTSSRDLVPAVFEGVALRSAQALEVRARARQNRLVLCRVVFGIPRRCHKAVGNFYVCQKGTQLCLPAS